MFSAYLKKIEGLCQTHFLIYCLLLYVKIKTKDIGKKKQKTKDSET